MLGTTILNLLRSLSLFLRCRRRIDRFVYYPSELPHLLLVLLLPVYVNLVKELFLLALFHAVFTAVFPKASAKVLLFSDMAKFFGEYFLKKFYFRELDNKNRRKDPLFGKSERNMSSNTILPIKYIKALTHV